MNRYLMGLMLALASTAATADCKQDCREAYTQCSQGAGTLDDTSWLKPTMEVYCSSAQAWVPPLGELQRFDKMPAA